MIYSVFCKLVQRHQVYALTLGTGLQGGAKTARQKTGSPVLPKDTGTVWPDGARESLDSRINAFALNSPPQALTILKVHDTLGTLPKAGTR